MTSGTSSTSPKMGLSAFFKARKTECEAICCDNTRLEKIAEQIKLISENIICSSILDLLCLNGGVLKQETLGIFPYTPKVYSDLPLIKINNELDEVSEGKELLASLKKLRIQPFNPAKKTNHCTIVFNQTEFLVSENGETYSQCFKEECCRSLIITTDEVKITDANIFEIVKKILWERGGIPVTLESLYEMPDKNGLIARLKVVVQGILKDHFVDGKIVWKIHTANNPPKEENPLSMSCYQKVSSGNRTFKWSDNLWPTDIPFDNLHVNSIWISFLVRKWYNEAWPDFVSLNRMDLEEKLLDFVLNLWPDNVQPTVDKLQTPMWAILKRADSMRILSLTRKWYETTWLDCRFLPEDKLEEEIKAFLLSVLPEDRVVSDTKDALQSILEVKQGLVEKCLFLIKWFMNNNPQLYSLNEGELKQKVDEFFQLNASQEIVDNYPLFSSWFKDEWPHCHTLSEEQLKQEIEKLFKTINVSPKDKKILEGYFFELNHHLLRWPQNDIFKNNENTKDLIGLIKSKKPDQLTIDRSLLNTMESMLSYILVQKWGQNEWPESLLKNILGRIANPFLTMVWPEIIPFDETQLNGMVEHIVNENKKKHREEDSAFESDRDSFENPL